MRRAELLLLALLPVFVIPAAAEAYLRFFEKDYAARLSQCLTLEPAEHHRFRPNCQEQIATPAGPVSYSTNEDGLRDAPRSNFPPGNNALLLGDSKIEGWWLAPQETLSHRLHTLLPNWKFLNGGIRYSSPAMLRIQLARYRAHYPLRAVFLVINGTDVADERLAYALASSFDPKGLPTALSLKDTIAPSWLEFLDAATLHSSQLVRVLRLAHYDREVIRLVKSQTRAPLCAAIQSLAANAGVDFYTIVLPLGPRIKEFPYMGESAEPPEFASMVECARAASKKLFDLRPLLPDDPDLYWKEHRNMNAKGTALVAEKLAEILEGELGNKKAQH